MKKASLDAFTACPPEHMTKRAQELESILKTQGLHPEPEGFRHLDCRCIYEICTQLPIIKRLSSLIGPNIILWRTHIFTGQPGSLAISWHQDFSNWPIPQGHTVSAWIAKVDLVMKRTRVNGIHLRWFIWKCSPVNLLFLMI